MLALASESNYIALFMGDFVYQDQKGSQKKTCLFGLRTINLVVIDSDFLLQFD
jgi:hypothetical protein